MKDQRVYLLHAIEAIDAIVSYTEDGREGYFADGKTQDAGDLGRDTDARTDGPLATDRRMRDKLIHEYFGVDLNLVWDVVERELPTLRPRLEQLSERLAADGGSSPVGPQLENRPRSAESPPSGRPAPFPRSISSLQISQILASSG